MLLSFFRTNQILNSVFFLLYLLILRGGFLLQGDVDVSVLQLADYGVLSNWVADKLDGSGRWVIEAISWLLLLIQAIYISVIARNHKLVTNQILLPGAMYLLVMSAIPEFLPLSSITLTNTFLIIAVNQLMKTYRSTFAARTIFDVGIWIAVACLFHFSYSVFVLLGIVGLGTLRAFKLSEAVTMWLGVLCVAFLAGTYMFWHDGLSTFWLNYVINNLDWLSFESSDPLSTYIGLSIIGSLLGIVIFGYSAIVQRQNIQFQKKVNVLYWTLLLGGVTILFSANSTLTHAAIVAVPIGFLLGLLLSNISKTTAEVIHLLLLFAVLAWQWHPYWLK